MPNVVTLYRKAAPEVPVPFVEIDAELCRVVGDPVDEVVWCRNWYNLLGLALALGHPIAELPALPLGPALLPIAAHLAEHYTSDVYKVAR